MAGFEWKNSRLDDKDLDDPAFKTDMPMDDSDEDAILEDSDVDELDY